MVCYEHVDISGLSDFYHLEINGLCKYYCIVLFFEEFTIHFQVKLTTYV